MGLSSSSPCTSQRDPLVDVTATFAEYKPTVLVEPSWRIVAAAPLLTENVHGVSFGELPADLVGGLVGLSPLASFAPAGRL